MKPDPLPTDHDSIMVSFPPRPQPQITESVCLLGGGHKQEREGQAEAPGPEHCGDAACGKLFSGYEGPFSKAPKRFLAAGMRQPRSTPV